MLLLILETSPNLSIKQLARTAGVCEQTTRNDVRELYKKGFIVVSSSEGDIYYKHNKTYAIKGK